MKPMVLFGAGAAVAAAVYAPLLRRRVLTWGATLQEIAAELPGDELLPDTELVSTRAIQIDAAPAAVWPWLVQMGSGRGGALHVRLDRESARPQHAQCR